MPTGATAPDEAAGAGGLVEHPAIAIANVIAKKGVRSSIRSGNIPGAEGNRLLDRPISGHDNHGRLSNLIGSRIAVSLNPA